MLINSDLLISHARNEAEKSITEAIQEAIPYINHLEYGELARRMLWATNNVFNDVFGKSPFPVYLVSDASRIRLGYGEWSSYDLVGRFGFVRFFIGHELMDDGDPCIVYKRYSFYDEPDNLLADTDWLICNKEDVGATPFVDRSSEIHGWNSKGPNRPRITDPADVIAVFDFYERQDLDKINDWKQEGCCLSEEHRIREYGSKHACCLEQIDSTTQVLRKFLEQNGLKPKSILHG